MTRTYSHRSHFKYNLAKLRKTGIWITCFISWVYGKIIVLFVEILKMSEAPVWRPRYRKFQGVILAVFTQTCAKLDQNLHQKDNSEFRPYVLKKKDWNSLHIKKMSKIRSYSPCFYFALDSFLKISAKTMKTIFCKTLGYNT